MKMEPIDMIAHRNLIAASTFAAALIVGLGTASAGECPADKVVAEGQGQAQTVTMPKAVTDNVLATVDLQNEIKGLKGRHLRIRELVIQPGGEVPTHSHANRPAVIYILEGTVVEYSSHCAVPIVHKAGQASIESKGEKHWWRNEGNTVVRLTSSDIVQMNPMSMAQRMK
jgi:quercetin dioxygenase-like cupin family protein